MSLGDTVRSWEPDDFDMGVGTAYDFYVVIPIAAREAIYFVPASSDFGE